MEAVARGGVRAATEFEVVAAYGKALLVEARPETGRKHQIRAHLAGARMPILGDRRYGGPLVAGDCMAPRVMLHASRLVLRHPATNVPFELRCPFPADFAALLACLRRQNSRRFTQNRRG